MPGDPTTQITLELEGLASENGHVRLHDLVEQLQALKAALDSVDKQVDQTKKATLYYRVVDMTHSSPVRITLEPVPKQKDRQVDVVARHHRFFRELQAVHANQHSEETDVETLDAFKRLVEKKDSAFARASIYNNTARVELDETFKDNVATMLRGGMFSFGTMVGRLEALSVHSNPTFWIYPEHGPRKVLCRIPVALKDKMVASIDKLVRVRGTKAFRPFARYPHKIEVREFDVIERTGNEGGLLGLRGSLVRDEDSVEGVRRIRDEWE